MLSATKRSRSKRDGLTRNRFSTVIVRSIFSPIRNVRQTSVCCESPKIRISVSQRQTEVCRTAFSKNLAQSWRRIDLQRGDNLFLLHSLFDRAHVRVRWSVGQICDVKQERLEAAEQLLGRHIALRFRVAPQKNIFVKQTPRLLRLVRKIGIGLRAGVASVSEGSQQQLSSLDVTSGFYVDKRIDHRLAVGNQI